MPQARSTQVGSNTLRPPRSIALVDPVAAVLVTSWNRNHISISCTSTMFCRCTTFTIYTASTIHTTNTTHTAHTAHTIDPTIDVTHATATTTTNIIHTVAPPTLPPPL
jgi:cytochrome c biogenesis factor